MSENRIDKAIGEANAAVTRQEVSYSLAEVRNGTGWAKGARFTLAEEKAVCAQAEADYARAERGELSASDKAFLNSWIDEMREQDRLSDLDYADRMLERLREDVDDH